MSPLADSYARAKDHPSIYVLQAFTLIKRATKKFHEVAAFISFEFVGIAGES
jgi:hypothetical protein